MIEYALMAAMVAIAAGSILPPMQPSISAVYSKVCDLFTRTPS
jgi:Flp pilus assembly pilin Flp